jgi:formylglycine-generating enzyme required for sulfatase activity
MDSDLVRKTCSARCEGVTISPEEVTMLPRSVIDTYHRELTRVVDQHGLDIFRMQPPKPSKQKTIRVCCGGPTAARLQGFKDLFRTDETSIRTGTIHANNSLIGYMQAQVVLLFFTDRADFNAWLADGVEADFLRLTQPVNVQKRFGVRCNEQIPLNVVREILGSDNASTSVDLDAAVRELGLAHKIETYEDSMVMISSGEFVYGNEGRIVTLPDDARGLFAENMYLLGAPSQVDGAVFYKCAPEIRGALNIGGSSVFDTTSVPNPFLMSQSQTTQALYSSVMGVNPSNFSGADRPVEQVTWFDMIQLSNALSGSDACYRNIRRGDHGFATWVDTCTGFRLPTESEWEYAARAFSPFTYSGSDNVGEVGWYRDNSNGETHPVGQIKPNAFGTYDMSGNLWEWCWDLYSWEGAYRVLRGGSWYYAADYLRAAYRNDLTPANQDDVLGGRLSRSIY